MVCVYALGPQDVRAVIAGRACQVHDHGGALLHLRLGLPPGTGQGQLGTIVMQGNHTSPY